MAAGTAPVKPAPDVFPVTAPRYTAPAFARQRDGERLHEAYGRHLPPSRTGDLLQPAPVSPVLQRCGRAAHLADHDRARGDRPGCCRHTNTTARLDGGAGDAHRDAHTDIHTLRHRDADGFGHTYRYHHRHSGANSYGH
jgi:hypothetical protein